MLTTTTEDGKHVRRPMALQGSAVSYALQTLRAAITRTPRRDPVDHDTVDL